MQTNHALGQFDALGSLSQETRTVEEWAARFPSIHAPITRWWVRNGKPVVTDVASARDAGALSEMAFAFETWAPRLA